MKLITQINKLLPYLKTPSDINTFHNVLVVSNTGLGDTILSTPAIISLRNSFLKKDPGINYIGMQLGGQDIYKMWPIDNFICLAEKVCKEFSNIKFVMFGSAKYEQNLVKKLIDRIE